MSFVCALFVCNLFVWPLRSGMITTESLRDTEVAREYIWFPVFLGVSVVHLLN